MIGRVFAGSRYPTPVSRLGLPTAPKCQLWLKNDGLINGTYGGNKVRKLERILPDALARGARRIVTLGAAGSHHVLATTLFARELGLQVRAALFPQPWTAHAERTLRLSLAHGLDALPTQSLGHAVLTARRLGLAGDWYVPAGGASVLGAQGFMLAVAELRAQIESGELPEPDVIVAPLGTGSTAAGLLAGVVREGLGTRVVGVEVARARGLTWLLVMDLARRASGASLGRLRAQLRVEAGHSGRGYGHETERSELARAIGAEHGLALDPTYTAKAFARALELVGHPALPIPGPLAASRVLYWHTLSSVEPSFPAPAAQSLGPLDSLLVR